MIKLASKNQLTDQGKRSKKGRLALIKENGQFKTVVRNAIAATENQLVTVYNNGQLGADYTLAQIRERALKK